jgi:hypothetical protein
MQRTMAQTLAIGKYCVSFMSTGTVDPDSQPSVASLHQVSTVLISCVLVLIISHQVFEWCCMLFCVLPTWHYRLLASPDVPTPERDAHPSIITFICDVMNAISK